MKRLQRLQKRDPGMPLAEGMKMLRGQQHIKYVNLTNATWCEDGDEKTDSRTFDGESLNPVNLRHLSPFLATVLLPQKLDQFQRHQAIRHAAARNHWPRIEKLLIHLERKQWSLFDKQYEELELKPKATDFAGRVAAAFEAIELNGRFFVPPSDTSDQQVRQRLALAGTTSATLCQDLAKYFQSKQKDESINQELLSIRNRWSNFYGAVAPIYNVFYWDEKKHNLDDYTLAQKRFEQLKPFFVDCFETFCRISVIAAGIEGIIFSNAIGVPKSKGIMAIHDFDVMPNGSKPDILKQQVVAGLFVPYIDHNLRNGLGHHSAHYEVKSDSIRYATENQLGLKTHQISYARFCEKVVRLYAQLELVSLYAHWLRKSALGIPLN